MRARRAPLPVFGLNNHSNSIIRYNRVSEEQERMAGLAAKAFGIKDAEKVLGPVPKGRGSTNFYVSGTDADGKRARLLLKRIETKTTRDALEWKLRTMGHCFDCFASVPRILRTLEGGMIHVSDGGLFCAMEFVDGKHFRGDEVELAGAAKEIALLHYTMADVVPFSGRMGGHRDFESMANTLEEAGCVTFMKGADEFDSLVSEFLGFMRDKLRYSKDSLSGGFRNQVVHGRVHPHNLLVKLPSVTLIGFDGFATGELAGDVACAVHRLVRQNVFIESPYDVHGQVKKMVALFFENYSGAGSTLQFDELRATPAFIAAEALARAAILIRIRLENGSPGDAEELKKHITSMLEAEYFMFMSRGF